MDAVELVDEMPVSSVEHVDAMSSSASHMDHSSFGLLVLPSVSCASMAVAASLKPQQRMRLSLRARSRHGDSFASASSRNVFLPTTMHSDVEAGDMAACALITFRILGLC